MTVVGLLRCQTDSYLRSLSAKVITCKPISKKKFHVEFDDTVFFPEGGGQPGDIGNLKLIGDSSDISVEDVHREGLKAIHTVEKPLDPGSEVEMQVDWTRRWDHMQQHTGQHLLSAVLDGMGLETLGWAMGRPNEPNYVELPRKMTPEEVRKAESKVTTLIAEAHPISVKIDENVDHKVPEDYDLESGVLRVVDIDGIDTNPCCGTHLSTTSHIGAIVLLHQVPNKQTNSRLFFFCGERVNRFASGAYSDLRCLGASLSCPISDVQTKLDSLQLRSRTLQTQLRAAEARLAKMDAEKMRSDKLLVFHQPDAGLEYLKAVARELGDEYLNSRTAVLLGGEGQQGGAILVVGADPASVSAKVRDCIVNVKGGGKGLWQGKVSRYEKGEIEKLFETLN